MGFDPELIEPVILSLQVAVVATLFALPLSVAVAWILSRKQFKGKLLLESIVMAPLVIPPLVTGYLLLLLLGKNGFIGGFLFRTFGIHIAFNWTGAAVAAGVMAFPLMVRAIQLSLDSINSDLEKMARTLGARRSDTFRTITLPLIMPGIISATILGFARSLGEFGATIVVAGNMPGKTQTIPLAIYSAINRPGGEKVAMTLLLVSLVLSVVSLIISHYMGKQVHALRQH